MKIAGAGRYSVCAYNSARESENRIHDDSIARQFGFRGGLVPGVDVYAYLIHPAVSEWGRLFLERGTAEIRFAKPVYDGSEAVVSAVPDGDALALEVESAGTLCAAGRAGLADTVLFAPDFTAPAPPAAEERPAADESSLAVGRTMAMRPFPFTAECAAAYLRDLRETDALYAAEGLAHPGMILRTGNWVLGHNVVLGPWIHVGSTVQHLSPAHIGEEIGARARVVANYDRKGHRFVELEVVPVANRTRPLAVIRHVAIYRCRQAG
jgi:acyl dehydratase